MTVLLFLAIAGTLVVFAALLWFIPRWQVRSLRRRWTNELQVIPLENQLRATLAQIVGGAVVLIGLYFNWQQGVATQKQVQLAQKGQITDRYTKAIEEIGNKDSPQVRIGGTYALEQIADESEDHRPAVWEVLSALVRQKAPIAPDALADAAPPHVVDDSARASVTALARPNRRQPDGLKFGDHAIVLDKTDLRGVNLPSGSNLAGSGVSLISTWLQDASAPGLYLMCVNMTAAKLNRADLTSAHLHGAILRNADLSNANLQGADLSAADLSEATINSNTDFRGATLDGACLAGVIDARLSPDQKKHAHFGPCPPRAACER